MSIHVKDIYDCVDGFAPFKTQEKWDNSGLLVGSPSQTVSKVLVSLDISLSAVERARDLGCEVIISHHPVIFLPMKNLPCQSVVYEMAKNGIAGICCHTPLDMAKGGINDILVDKLWNVLDFSKNTELLDEDGFGRIVTLTKATSTIDIAKAAKKALHCEMVRCSKWDEGIDHVVKLGICSGSGASMLEDVAGRCDALLTGDVKHDRWYKAEELGLGLIDCGHYHTEVVMVKYVSKKLKEAFPDLQIFESEEGDPVAYV